MEVAGCVGGAAVKVVIAGGTGSLGRRIADDLAQRGHTITILTRAPRDNARHRQVGWDGRTVGDWTTELDSAVLVNLCGELVDRRPTSRNIELLRQSRMEPTRALVAAASTLQNPPELWLQMSTLAIYGDGGQDVIDEVHPVADGPPQMAGVAHPWEQAANGAAAGRLVIMRTGLVLDRDSPVLKRLRLITKLGLGGRISTGDQWVSWIHIGDFLDAVTFVFEHRNLDGVVHFTAPNPVQNKAMMATLRSAFRRPWSPPTPKPLVHLGAALMRSDPALGLTGRRCIPRRLTDAGFTFNHPTFESAICELVAPRNSPPCDYP